ncbi:MAG: hypothetical protein ACI9R3_001537 [Verrucomicrobiales bacterium]|jgi:hypothetical protein
MNNEMLIEELRKLTPAQRQVAKEFLLADTQEEASQDRRSLREVLSQSPFAKMDFEPPQGVRSPIRPVEL